MNFAEISDPVAYNTVLNPKLWQGSGQLKSQVRGALLSIAQDFKDYIDVPFTVVDVIITGSNVNYNYTNNSDLDLHLIADFDSVDCDREASELFDAKRLLYAEEHNIEVYGIPVGLYVEDQDHPGVSAGSYSILRDQWLNKPSKVQPKYDADQVMRMTQVWRTVIQHAMQTGDLHVCRNTVQLLRKYRKLGLAQSQGEFSTANLVYKALRNDDVISGMVTLINRLHDQQLSLK